MAGFLRRIVGEFDRATAALEAEAAEMAADARLLHEQADEIESEAEKIRRETSCLSHQTRKMYDETLAEIATAMENAATVESREMLWKVASDLYRILPPH